MNLSRHFHVWARAWGIALFVMLIGLAIADTIAPAHSAEPARHDRGVYIFGGAGWTDYADPDAGLTAEPESSVTADTDDSWAALIGAGYRFHETPLALEIRGTYARHYAPDGVAWLPTLEGPAALPVTRIQLCALYAPDIGLTLHPYAGPCVGAGWLGVDPTGRDGVPTDGPSRSLAVADVGFAVDVVAGVTIDITRDGSLQTGPEFGVGWVPLASRKVVDHEDESMEWRVLWRVVWFP